MRARRRARSSSTIASGAASTSARAAHRLARALGRAARSRTGARRSSPLSRADGVSRADGASSRSRARGSRGSPASLSGGVSRASGEAALADGEGRGWVIAERGRIPGALGQREAPARSAIVRHVSQLIVPRRLTPEAYAPYGRVLMASPRGEPGESANLGTALRFDDVCDVRNTRAGTASLKVKVFRSRPVPRERRPLALLEKHPCSTQLFIPMNASRFIALVALGGDVPDLTTLAAFIAEGPQGISYAPGVWHHPMLTLDVETDFVVFVHEDGTPEDCVVVDRAGADWPELDLASVGDRAR
ncbi:MAG: ureidoglycolate lyase [Labilithrix sp.]|nr:ureidoglycolate lyase [Labilithrix sp.]